MRKSNFLGSLFQCSMVLGIFLLICQVHGYAQTRQVSTPVAGEVQEYPDNNIVNGMFRPISPEEEVRTRDPRPSSATSGPSTTLGASKGQLELALIPSSWTGTGSTEWIQYQLPQGYDPFGDPHPLLVCWHGYGQSCSSVANQSQIDEECFRDRNWIYLSITGETQTNFGYLPSQVHCTKAIEYLISNFNFNIDTNRIYMVGWSMGGGGAASYVSRHLATGEGYHIAGLVLISAAADWTYAYNQGDPGALLWLPLLLGGGTPTTDPFAYKQISTLYIENDNYVLNESMGQNLRHNLPVFITYAGNDSLTYGPFLNQQLIALFTEVGANVLVDYYPVHAYPHSWLLLDIDTAFDFIEPYELDDQETDSINLLVDRDATFYWDEVTQNTAEVFSEIVGTVNDAQNSLNITEATNIDTLNVNCTDTGLDDSQDLTIDFGSSFAGSQTLELEPLLSEPNYVMDSSTGILFQDYTYSDVTDILSITRDPAETLDLRASYVPFDMLLAMDETVQVDGDLMINVDNGPNSHGALVILSKVQHETPVEDRYILVDPFSPGGHWHFGVLDGAGSLRWNLHVPNKPALAGNVYYVQTITFISSLTGVSNLDSFEVLP